MRDLHRRTHRAPKVRTAVHQPRRGESYRLTLPLGKLWRRGPLPVVWRDGISLQCATERRMHRTRADEAALIGEGRLPRLSSDHAVLLTGALLAYY